MTPFLKFLKKPKDKSQSNVVNIDEEKKDEILKEEDEGLRNIDNTDENKPNKNNFWISILSYLFFLGLSYVISQYIEIPLIISFALYYLFGAIAVLIKIEPNRLKKLKNVPLLRKHFSMMYKINIKIRESFDKGTIKGSFSFATGMIYLILYFAWLNFLLATIKYIISFIYPISNPFQFIEAFWCLLGAGMMAFIKWMNILIQHQSKAKELLKSDESHRKIKFIGSQLSFRVGLYIIVSAYINWALGLIIFLLASPFFNDYFLSFLIGAGFFLIILLILLLLIILIGTPKQGVKQKIEE
ncbi:MAG: hypothetical protein K9W44_04185 [Candidatus Lokiarchaeota archaeon]|nr:hypothetical protein [Candidatus Harpocratesius repetitus]